MNNQIIIWSLFIIPWLSFLLMNKTDVKRLMPVALFSALTSGIIFELGVTAGLWNNLQAPYPLALVQPYNYGANAAIAAWVLRFTYGRFWIYILTNALLDIGFAFVFFRGTPVRE